MFYLNFSSSGFRFSPSPATVKDLLVEWNTAEETVRPRDDIGVGWSVVIYGSEGALENQCEDDR